MVAPATYDLTSAIGRVRLLIPDTRIEEDITRLFEDVELATFLTLTGQAPLLAAAMALDTLAADEAMTSKAIRLLDLTTDGPATAAAFRATATSHRAQHDALMRGGGPTATLTHRPTSFARLPGGRAG